MMDSPAGRLRARDATGNTAQETFDFVAVCTGQFNERKELHHPGEDAFRPPAA